MSNIYINTKDPYSPFSRSPYRRLGDYIVNVDTNTAVDASHWDDDDWSEFWGKHPNDQFGQVENMSMVTSDDTVLIWEGAATMHKTGDRA